MRDLAVQGELDVFLSFWGKSFDQGSWHPAAYHCLDVAAVAQEMLETGAVRPPRLWPAPASAQAIAALVALHDIGKFSRPFQAQVEALWPECLGAFTPIAATPRHDTAGAMLLAQPLRDALEPILAAWGPFERDPVIRALCGHHGRPPANESRLPEVLNDSVCQRAAGDFAAQAVAAIGGVALPNLEDRSRNAFGWWLAGLTVLADWIGSGEAHFPPHPPCVDLATYWHSVARPAARCAVAASGVLPSIPAKALRLDDLVGRPALATPVQQALQDLDIGDDTPLLAVIEDQTGSGKTEAALLLAHRLMAAGRADGLYVALPTMATANAMYARLHAAYAALFAPGQRPSLVLAHGRRMDNPAFSGSILDHSVAAAETGEADDPADETATAQCAAWIAGDRRRTFLAAVGVGTIDQALLGVLPSRHAPLRLLGLSARVLLVDEAHAYDPYMEEELARLVTFQAALGGSTIILSATLTQAQRKKLVSAYQEAVGVPKKQRGGIGQIAYPQITLAQQARLVEQPCAARAALARQVRVERIDRIELAVAEIAAAVARGQAVAWVRNAVDDAIEARDMLAAAGIEATLFHARFAMGHRLDIEKGVLSRFGRDSTDRAGVVVGTQVIEQSLDLDFDVLITDLAPIDLVIQRAGRLWRHPERKRLDDQPRLLLLAPEPVDAPGPDWLAGAWRRTAAVYGRIDILWRTARALAKSGMIDTPGAVRELVESVYAAGDEPPPGLLARSDRAAGRDHGDRAQAVINLLEFGKCYDRNSGAWDSDIRTPTRLTELSLTLRLARWDGATLRPICDADTPRRAWSLSEVSVPLRRCKGVPEPEPEVARALISARADCGKWERDIPVLALEGDRPMTGLFLDEDGSVVVAGYSLDTGLLL